MVSWKWYYMEVVLLSSIIRCVAGAGIGLAISIVWWQWLLYWVPFNSNYPNRLDEINRFFPFVLVFGVLIGLASALPRGSIGIPWKRLRIAVITMFVILMPPLSGYVDTLSPAQQMFVLPALLICVLILPDLVLLVVGLAHRRFVASKPSS